MSIKGRFYGAMAYSAHIQGNRLSDQGKSQAAKQKHDKAMALYEKAMAHHDNAPRDGMAYGVLLLRMGRFEEARERMYAVDKSNGLAKDEKRTLRINYSICLWKLGRLDDAIDLLTEVSRDGKNTTIYGSLGFMLIERAVKTGDFAEAQAFTAESLDYDEDDPVVLDNAAQLCAYTGDRKGAYEYYRRALNKKPTQVDSLYGLAQLNIEDGNLPRAKELLSRALSGNFSALATVTREQAQKTLDALE